MDTPVETWHFFAAIAVCVVVGAIGHVLRAVVNVLPDRLSDSERLDLILSDGYQWTDRLFGTEYDDGGYYKLDSARNLKLSCLMAAASGLCVFLFVDDAAHLFAQAANFSVEWLKDLVIFRVNELTGR